MELNGVDPIQGGQVMSQMTSLYERLCYQRVAPLS
jgi:hypothetical protein